MVKRKGKRKDLGDSWVVESSEADSTNTDDDTYVLTPSKAALKPVPRRKVSNSVARPSVEPQLIMPSIYADGIRSRNSTPIKQKTILNGAKRENAGKHDRVHGRSTKSSEPLRRKATNGKLDTQQVKLVKYLDGLIFSEGGILGNLRGLFSWLFGILRRVFVILQTPLAYFLAIYLLFGLFVFTRNLMTTSISSALSPICRIPGSQLLNLPFCKSPISGNDFQEEHVPPVEFSQLVTVQSKFDQILEDAAGSIGLPMIMKRTESSLRDLREVVRYSRLHSKGELVLELDGFISTASIASFDLQKFNSHIGRSVDNIINTGRWTQRVLDSIAERDSGRSAVEAFISDKLLAPFQPIRFTEDAVLDQYLKHARVVQEEILVLLAEAQALHMVLQNLEDRLGVINGICIRDEIQKQSEKDEILSLLWTKLGGNRSKLGKQDSELRLLQDVNQYRKTALAHVAGMILKLQAMSTELDELRTRVKTSASLGDHLDIPLSVHIDNIRSGIERLQIGRAEARNAENSYTRKILDGVPVEISAGRIDG